MKKRRLSFLELLVPMLVVLGCGASSAKSRHYQGASAPAMDAESISDDSGDSNVSRVAEAAPASAPAMPDRESTRSMPAKKALQATPPPAQPTTGKPQPSTRKAPVASARKKLLLIYTANVYLAVFEAVKGLDAVEKLADDMGGYLVQRNAQQITVRVPAAKFKEALEAVSKMGDELRRDVTAQDVTAQFRDLETRLANLVAVRDRLQALLARAKNVNEAIQVENQLTRVTEQIEVIKGRLKLFKELIAFSTITVSFRASPVEKVASQVKLPFPWLRRLSLSNLLSL